MLPALDSWSSMGIVGTKSFMRIAVLPFLTIMVVALASPSVSAQQQQQPMQILQLQQQQWFRFGSSLGSSPSGSSNSGSLKASGEIYDSLEWLDDLELRNNTLRLLIMEEPLKFESFDYLAPAFAPLRYLNLTLSDYFKGVLVYNFGLPLKHDSVIIEYDDCKWIKAEKGGESEPGKKDGGIKLMTVENCEAPENWLDEGDRGPGRYSERFSSGVIDLGEGKVKWFLKQFRQLLSADDPDYNAVSANCWRHAFRSTKGVLEWIIENTQSEPARDTLKKKLEDLAKLERPMPMAVALRVALLLSLIALTVKAIERLRRILARTGREELPEINSPPVIIESGTSQATFTASVSTSPTPDDALYASSVEMPDADTQTTTSLVPEADALYASSVQMPDADTQHN